MVRTPSDALHEHFGFREFLDGQEPVVTALLENRDAMVVMPTGGGKSLCYQLPALVKKGVTIVVSPLIALMKDQVDALERKGIPAAMINSTLTLDEQRQRLDQLRAGELKLIYVAPERFRSRGFRQAMQKVEISLFAVDEAHCLSQWGHDFRPDYLRLGEAVEDLGHPQTAAFTATATPQVRKDILNTLKLRDPFVTVTGFERPNLSLNVELVDSNKAKFERVQKIVSKWKTGIVYCSTRKKVTETQERLESFGFSSVAYHGGMEDHAREAAQNAFLDRKFDIAVATNAFGMGIDRSDVRFVIHYDVPGSLEAYYQEAGRAGRDREPAYCELLFNYADTQTQEFFIDGANPDISLIRSTWDALVSHANENHEVQAPIKELAGWVGAKNDMGVGTAISILNRTRYLERFDIPGVRARGTRLLHPELRGDELQLDEESLRAKAGSDREKLASMIRFSYAEDCRQEWILNYFGEKEASPCGSCDRCVGEATVSRRTADEAEALIVRKALSGVARMCHGSGNQWRGRFGKGRIVNMLVGSRAADILDRGLDRLTTYGLLKDEGSAYVYALFKELEKAGLVVTEKGEYPLLALTARGSAVMRGKAECKLAWPDRARLAKKKPRRSGAASRTEAMNLEGAEFDPGLYEKLKAKRSQIAQAEGGKPAFTIFNNETLEYFARLKPTTFDDGLNVKGVGKVKADRYLQDFVDLIKQHMDS